MRDRRRGARSPRSTPRTAYAVWKLRQDVFVVEQECPYPDLDGRDLEPGHPARRAARTTTALLGCARVLDDGDRRGGSAGWRCTATARGPGLADRLMQAALQVCPDRDVVLDAQSPLAGWYASFGFEVDGPEFLEDGIPHLPMRRRHLK